jgi:thiol-disulfide isomerase/thioredoxin
VLFLVGAVTLAAGIVGLPAQFSTAPPSPATVLDLRVTRDNGSVVPLRDIVRDVPAIVAFWASYCPPCRAEVPALNQAAAHWRSRGVRVVGVALETDADRVRAARRSWGIRYDVLRVAPGQDDLLERLFPHGLPATAFVARGEATLHEHVVDTAELDRRVSALLEPVPLPR